MIKKGEIQLYKETRTLDKKAAYSLSYLYFVIYRVLDCMIYITLDEIGPFQSYYYFTTLLVVLQVRSIMETGFRVFDTNMYYVH